MNENQIWISQDTATKQDNENDKKGGGKGGRNEITTQSFFW